MTSPSGPGRLTTNAHAELTARVERFCAGWTPGADAEIAQTLPPPGSEHRLAVLVQLVLADMQRRAAARLPFRVERYINLFPDDLATHSVPAELLVAEYRLRHQYTDRPKLTEYERWFPNQFEAISEAIQREPLEPACEATRFTNVPATGQVVDTLVKDDQRPGSPPPRPSDVLPSDTPYRLVRKLGAGAFGEVFEARAPGEIPVAVKRIMRTVDHPSSRSEREALEAIKKLSHPFLLKTNAYWILDDRLVIVMELADGSLAERIEHYRGQNQTGIPPEELVPLFEQAAEALDYLHSENVSHRDIKPENILILRGYAKVADFGLARSQEHTLSVVVGTVGTPAYMAPEMWKEQVSLQSDQYSLAATYVRARLGRPLFQTTVLVDMANSHLNDTPDLTPLPPAEVRVLLKALAKNPTDRYPTCVAFAEALREAVFPAPKPPAPRRRTAVLLAAVPAACALVAALLIAFGPFRGKQQGEAPVEKAPVVVVQQKDVVVVKEAEKPLVAFAGWTAGPGEPKTFGEKRYPPTFTCPVAEETLVARLIYPTGPDGHGEPPPFYMLENKITNRVFSRVWAELERDPGSELSQLLAAGGQKLVRRAWEHGTGADVPVLGITGPEAILVARRLGGDLPIYLQWQKATGYLERKPVPPPAGDRLTEGLDPETEKKRLEQRGLALGLNAPVPVTAGSRDRSSWEIRQLVSNGEEWLGQLHPGTGYPRMTLFPDPPNPDDSMAYVGRAYHERRIIDFKTIREKKECELSFEMADGKSHFGFRIVLEP
jgi:hypothetical protein